MIGNVSIINPKLVTGPNSTSTIETKARMATMMARTLAIKVRKLPGLNRHRRIREEEKKVEKRKLRAIDYMI